MTSGAKWLTTVILIPERERLLMVGFRGNQDCDELDTWAGNWGVPTTSIGRPLSERGSVAQTISPRLRSSNVVTVRAPSRRSAGLRDLLRRTAQLRFHDTDEAGRRTGAGRRR